MTARKFTATLIVAALALSVPVALLAAGTETPSGADNDSLTRARALIKEKDFGSAIPILTMVTSEDPRNADAFNWLGYSLRKTGKYDAAETAYGKALSIDPAHKGALEYLGELYVETKRPDKAREILARLSAACPGGCEELEDLKEMIAKGN